MDPILIMARKLIEKKLFEMDEEHLVFLMQILYTIKLKSESDLLVSQEIKNNQSLTYEDILNDTAMYKFIADEITCDMDDLFLWNKILDKIKNNTFELKDIVLAVGKIKDYFEGFTEDEINDFINDLEDQLLKSHLSPTYDNDKVIKIIIEYVDMIKSDDFFSDSNIN